MKPEALLNPDVGAGRALETAIESFEALKWAVFGSMVVHRRSHELVAEARAMCQRDQAPCDSGRAVHSALPQRRADQPQESGDGP